MQCRKAFIMELYVQIYGCEEQGEKAHEQKDAKKMMAKLDDLEQKMKLLSDKIELIVQSK